MVDSGCTDNIIYQSYCERFVKRSVSVTTVGGERLTCDGVGRVVVETPSGQRAEVSVLVLSRRPLGVDLILGMGGISALGGVVVRSPSEVAFCGGAIAAGSELAVDAPDYVVHFDPRERIWKVSWKWSNGSGPERLKNQTAMYNVPEDIRSDFDGELSEWVANGWLIPYDEARLGPPRGLIPLMAVDQPNKQKVRPVMDYRELNSHITAHTAEADVCAEQLRRWRRRGKDVAIVDLRRAYLQLHMDERLWPFQTVVVNGRRHCLTRMGFGLSVAPEIMRSVVKTILAQHPKLESGVLGYVDDLLVDESVVDAEEVVEHFKRFGLECKPPVRAADGARVLGLRVSSDARGGLRWTRDNPAEAPPARTTRRAVFSWCGKLVAHFPVCGWLRPAAAWLKRRVNEVTRGWDDLTDDSVLRKQMDHVWARLEECDPVRGSWCVSGLAAVVWVDASSLAEGVVITSPEGCPIEDACWLRRDESSHINIAELDAAIRGINLAVAWGMKSLDLRTDSVNVHRWISDALTGRARLRTKAQSELLIRRRVGVVKQIVDELSLAVSVTLVRSCENRADSLTRVPKDWLRDGVAAAGAVLSPPAGESRLLTAIADVHERAGHPGVRKTLYFARRDVSKDVTRGDAKMVVSECDVCQSVDPAPVHLPHGSLEVDGLWERLAMDITHYQSRSYLSLIDCGPSRFCLWGLLHRPDADAVAQFLSRVFSERGAPLEILCDNDTVFRGRRLAALTAKWRVALRFRAAYAPAGNGIVERNHRTIKVIAARKQCSIEEAVHIYNVTPRDGESEEESPAGGLYRYRVRDCIGSEEPLPEAEGSAVADHVSDFSVGDPVWVRRRGSRCTERSQPGVVTAVISSWVVEVDGTPRHVRDLRRRAQGALQDAARSSAESGPDDSDVPLFIDQGAVPAPESTVGTSDSPAVVNGTLAVVSAGPVASQSSSVVAVPTSASAVPATSAALPVTVEQPVLRRSGRKTVEVKKFCCEFGYCKTGGANHQ